MERSWYQQDWAIIALLVFFFPVGLYLMWKHASWQPRVKLAISGSLAVLVVIVVVASAVGGGTDDTDSERTVLDEPTRAASSPTPEPPRTNAPTEVLAYSVLEIEDVSVSGTSVSISGLTDLPTGASLTVGFDVSGRSGSDRYIGVDERTTVSNRRFAVTLEVPQRDEFATGPYEVSVLFTPRGQDDSVLALVGKDGERLMGNLVDDVLGFKTMEVVQTMDLQLSVSPPSYVFQQASEFPQGSPERALAEYVAAWRDQDWQKMVSRAQITWVDADSDPAGTLEAFYDFKDLMGFEVTMIAAVSEVTTDVTFVVHYEAFTNEVEKKEITARVIKETAPFETSTQGQWGVNPISTLSETDVE